MQTRILSLILALCLTMTAVYADGPGAGWVTNQSGGGGGGGAPTDGEYVLWADNVTLTNPRVLVGTSPITVTIDGSAHGNATLSLTTVPINLGGTGQTTAQLGFNALANGTAGAAVAGGDILYYNGTNWARLAKGSDGQFLNLASGLPAWTTAASGAPAAAQYLTLALDGGLSAERVATAGSGISLTDGGANSTLTIAVDSTVVRTTGAQNIAGVKTMTDNLEIDNGDALVLKGASFNITIDGADPAANRTYVVPDVGAGADFIMSQGAQTKAGVLTLSSAPVLSTGTLTSVAALMTFPSTAQTLVGRTSSDVLTNKELTAPSFTSSSLTLKQSSADYSVQWANPAAGRTYTIRDVTTNAHFAMSATTTTYTNGGIAYGNGNVLDVTSAGSSGQPLLSQGAGAPTWGTLGQAFGGTGFTSYTAGDLITVNDAGTLVKLAGGTDGHVLTYDSTGNPNVKWAAGGSGAPADATYLVVSLNGTLTNERNFAVGNGIAATDSGAGAAYTLRVATTAKGDIIAGTAATTAAAVTVGANGTFLIADSSQSAGLTYTKASRFGGDGSDGAITISGSTTDEYYVKNATTYTVNSSQTHTVAAGSIINTTGAVTINGTVSGNSLGYAGAVAAGTQNLVGFQGYGPSPGMGGNASNTASGGGGGGSSCGNGGDGGQVTTSVRGGYGGLCIGTAASTNGKIVPGSGGGGAGTASSGSAAAAGAGGGTIIICAKGSITLAGTTALSATGGAGGAGTTAAGGSGGGGGGAIAIYSEDSGTGIVKNSSTNTINVTGGAGGNAAGTGHDGGGGGAGGLAILMAPTFSGSGTATVAGGAGGTQGSSGTVGANGGSGDTVQVTGTPNLMVVGMHIDGRGLGPLIAIEKWKQGSNSIKLNSDEHSSWMAAFYAKPGRFDEVRTAVRHGGNVDQVTQMCAVDIAPAFQRIGTEQEFVQSDVEIGDAVEESIPCG